MDDANVSGSTLKEALGSGNDCTKLLKHTNKIVYKII
jgi:hypothetical protein